MREGCFAALFVGKGDDGLQTVKCSRNSLIFLMLLPSRIVPPALRV